MTPELLAAVLFGSMLLALAMGVPLAFVLGGVAMVFTYFLWGQDALYIVATSTSGLQMSLILVCAPMFVLMGNILKGSGIADDLFEAIYHWLGPIKGGLAIGTVLICTIFAAMVGVSAVGVLTIGIIALPAMFKRNYQKSIAMGSIMAGAALGTLIPPSIIMIFYAFMAEVSIGQLFIGGIIPGLILSGSFCIYIGIRCKLQPHLAPSMPLEETVSWREKFVLLRWLILPVFLIFLVLGTIFLGVCSVMEAAAVGAFGSVVCAAINRKLSFKLVKEASLQTLKLTAMCYWIVLGARCFSAAWIGIGGQDLVRNTIATLGVGRWGVLIAMQSSYFILGCLLDPLGIIMLTAPIYIPIAIELGFNLVWFGILYTVNMEMAFLTPPFGFNLFYMKSIVPEGITMGDIYRSVSPFVIIQMIGLILVMLFPQLVLWLPSLMIR